MGFLSYNENGFIGNPATRYLKVSGGEKASKDEAGNIIKKAQFTVSYYDGEGNIEVEVPYKFGIIDQSHQVTGFSPEAGVRFFSNEAFTNDGVLTVKRKAGDQPATDVLSGPYSEIKPSLPQGARYQANLYVYNFETHSIERLDLRGSALRAYFEFQRGEGRKGRIYECLTVMEEGELTQNGSVVYIPPKFKLGAPYTDEMKSELVEASKEVENYKKYRQVQDGVGTVKTGQSVGESQASDAPSNVVETLPPADPMDFPF